MIVATDAQGLVRVAKFVMDAADQTSYALSHFAAVWMIPGRWMGFDANWEPQMDFHAPQSLTLVATDRYRLNLGSVSLLGDGENVWPAQVGVRLDSLKMALKATGAQRGDIQLSCDNVKPDGSDGWVTWTSPVGGMFPLVVEDVAGMPKWANLLTNLFKNYAPADTASFDGGRLARTTAALKGENVVRVRNSDGQKPMVLQTVSGLDGKSPLTSVLMPTRIPSGTS